MNRNVLVCDGHCVPWRGEGEGRRGGRRDGSEGKDPRKEGEEECDIGVMIAVLKFACFPFM